MDSSVILFQALLFLHFIGLALGIGGVFVADFSFLRAIRKRDQLALATATWLRSFSVVMWVGFILLAISGVGMFLFDPSRYLHSAGFQSKMALVLILFINGLLLNTYSSRQLATINFSEEYEQHESGWKARKIFLILGVLGTLTWYAILFIAMFKSYTHATFFKYMGGYAILVLVSIAAGLILERVLSVRVESQPLTKEEAQSELPAMPVDHPAEQPPAAPLTR